MCCLFGLIDINGSLTGRQKSKMISALAEASEARGTDATGIAYNSGGKMRIYKRPLPAHKMKLHIPKDARVVMGHTRMTTQGNAKKNANNHPWKATAGKATFALAHNGILYNDHSLQKSLQLPSTPIETDSFVAVQILQKTGTLTFDSLKDMAERVEGSFVFSVLDQNDNLYFVKGENPLCIYHYPKAGVYLYASTEEILTLAICMMKLPAEMPEKISLTCGDILRIDRNGEMKTHSFSTAHLHAAWYYRPHRYTWRQAVPPPCTGNTAYIRELKSIASFYGYDGDDIDMMLSDGFTTDDIENMIYCGEV